MNELVWNCRSSPPSKSNPSAGCRWLMAYLHVGDPDALVIDVVGVPDASMAGMNVLWVG